MSEVRSVEIPSHEVLSQLALNDPTAYEAWRCEVIESFINNAPARNKLRLRGLQWRVDCVRQQSRSALGATVKVYELMWHSFLQLNNKLEELVGMPSGNADFRSADGAKHAERSARIIEFRLRPAPGQGCSGTQNTG